jgi:signal peptidase II
MVESKPAPVNRWTIWMSRFLILATIGLNIGCDQVSKNLVRQHVDAHATIPVLGSFITLTHVQNTGAFLSLGNSLPDFLRHVLLTVLPIGFLALALVYLLVKSRLSLATWLGASLMIGGGIGNIYDRVKYGSVTDFLHMKVSIFQTGIFNVADMSIMAGMALLIFSGIGKKPAPHPLP